MLLCVDVLSSERTHTHFQGSAYFKKMLFFSSESKHHKYLIVADKNRGEYRFVYLVILINRPFGNARKKIVYKIVQQFIEM